ncbi:MAG: sulfotransferase [Cytophagales bacterium]
MRSRKIKDKNNNSHVPHFFIIGSGRCGSTLLRTLLIKNPSVHIPPEFPSLINIIKKYYRYKSCDWNDLISILIGELATNKSFVFWNIDLEGLRTRLLSFSDKDQSLEAIINLIYESHRLSNKPDSRIIGDKTTSNALRLKWINYLYPEAKIINLVRDGRAVARSYINSNLMSNSEDIIRKWNESICEAEKFKRKYKTRDNFITIKYEDLVDKPQLVCNFIYDFIGVSHFDIKTKIELPNDDLSLHHHQNVHLPITNHQSKKWMTFFSKSELQNLSKKMKSNLELLGYEL